MIPYRMNPLGISGAPYKRKLEYLESTGTQWIDSGWRLSDPSNTFELDTRVVVGTAQSNIYCCICGVNNSGGAGDRQYYLVQVYNRTTTSLVLHHGNSSKSVTTTNVSYPADIRVTYNGSGTTEMIINDVVNTLSDSITSVPDLSMYIFSTNYNIVPAKRQNITGKIYFFKIKESGVFVRDFIPVLDNNDTPCMYDRVSKQLFYNQGSGQFLYA